MALTPGSGEGAAPIKPRTLERQTRRDSLSPLDVHGRPARALEGTRRRSDRFELAFPNDEAGRKPESRMKRRSFNGALPVGAVPYRGQQLPRAPAPGRQEKWSRSSQTPALATIPATPERKPAMQAGVVDESTACSPRSPTKHRPAALELHRTFGCTATTTAELRQQIRETRSDDSTTVLQVPQDTRQPLPPTPTTPFVMGNKPSSTAGSVLSDDASVRVGMRRDFRVPMSRKSSSNLFKRIDSKSPLPRDVTAGVMSAFHRDGLKTTGYFAEDGDNVTADARFQHVEIDPDDNRYHGSHRYRRSASTNMTTTSNLTTTPRRGDSAIHNGVSTDLDASEDLQVDGTAESPAHFALPPDEDDVRPPEASPTIPTPSPLPEDSPHKYGLKDDIDVVEKPNEPEATTVAKMKRKSSGVEIFNEATTLQTAQSFLNGLSTSRRRAESAATVHPTNAAKVLCGTAFVEPLRPSSARPSSRPRRSCQEGEGRRKGHNFKSSGFAYSRPLTLAQIKCYREHAQLLPSRNKSAPVECAVCHMDDGADHFSCSWCALRMCRYCRKDFAERGLSALRIRVRKAELGNPDDSPLSSSTESLPTPKQPRNTSTAQHR